MPTPTRSRARPVLCAALLLVTQTTACHTWRPIQGASDQQVSNKPISEARLTLRSGAQLTLHDVTVRSDSVIGFFGDLRDRRAVPVADVTSIDQREVSAGRTTATVLGASAVAFAALIVVALFASGATVTGP